MYKSSLFSCDLLASITDDTALCIDYRLPRFKGFVPSKNPFIILNYIEEGIPATYHHLCCELYNKNQIAFS